MGWDYFNNDLKYEYVKLLLKDLSPVENGYLKFLRDGVDSQIIDVLKWYDEYEEDIIDLHDQEELDEYSKDYLEMILITLLDNMLNKNKSYIESFYNSGSNLAYSHMNKNKLFLPSDTEALNNLTEYGNSIVKSINSELAYGVKKSLGEHVENKTLDQFKKDLISLPYKPIDTHFSVDNRCVFTTKTEYARGVNTGLLQAYSNYGVDQYDWITSGLPNVCKTCRAYEENNPYTLNGIINRLPVHPNCVCSVKARLPKELYLRENPRVVDLTPKKEKRN